MISTQRLYQINSSRILQHIKMNPGKSRISIAADLDLNRSTITKVVRTFLQCGLVRVTGKRHDTPGAGRMAIGLEIDPSFVYVLGIEAQTEFFRTVLVDLSGVPVRSDKILYRYKEQSLEAQLSDIITCEIKRCNGEGRILAGAGIGFPGIVDPYRGVILHSHPLNTKNLEIKREIENACGVPVFVENDANCCCWSEMAFSRGKRARNFITLLGEFRKNDVEYDRKNGFSFGIGIVIRDEVLHGDNFTAGEFQSLMCNHMQPRRSQFSFSVEEIMTLPNNVELLEKVFAEIAFNISLIVNTFDISKILVAGDIAAYGSVLTPLLEREVSLNWLYREEKLCQIEYSPDGENAVCMGAAGLFIKKLFSVPGMTDHVDEEVGSILLGRIVDLYDKNGR